MFNFLRDIFWIPETKNNKKEKCYIPKEKNVTTIKKIKKNDIWVGV